MTGPIFLSSYKRVFRWITKINGLFIDNDDRETLLELIGKIKRKRKREAMSHTKEYRGEKDRGWSYRSFDSARRAVFGQLLLAYID